MILNLVCFVIGLLMLYYGASWLVKGSSGLARNLGLTPLVIGLTVVAFGTSAPELVISVVSSIKYKSMIGGKCHWKQHLQHRPCARFVRLIKAD